jgi:putative transposase
VQYRQAGGPRNLTCPLSTSPQPERESARRRKQRRRFDGVGKKFTAEQIIGKLREAEVELSRGKKVPQMCRKIGVTEQMYYRWKKEYGCLRMDQPRRLKELEKENARRKRLLTDAELDTAILQEDASGIL